MAASQYPTSDGAPPGVDDGMDGVDGPLGAMRGRNNDLPSSGGLYSALGWFHAESVWTCPLVMVLADIHGR